MDQDTFIPARDRAAFGSACVSQHSSSSHPFWAHPAAAPSFSRLDTGSADKASPTSRKVPIYYRFPFPRSAHSLYFCSLLLHPTVVQTYLFPQTQLQWERFTFHEDTLNTASHKVHGYIWLPLMAGPATEQTKQEVKNHSVLKEQQQISPQPLKPENSSVKREDFKAQAVITQCLREMWYTFCSLMHTKWEPCLHCQSIFVTPEAGESFE